MIWSNSYKDGIFFSQIPPPAEQGKESTVPFEITIFSSVTGDHVIDLYSQRSLSQPYQEPQNKWSHLIPQWRFTDLSGNVVTQVQTTDTLVYDGSGNVVGVTGTARFYYIDDFPVIGCNPVLLWTTMSVSGYSVSLDTGSCDNTPGFLNSKVITVAPYYINGLAPDYLDISRDGKNPMFDIYWMQTHIPEVITVKGRSGSVYWCPDTGTNDPIIFSVPPTNLLGLSGGPVIRNLSGVLSSDQTWDPDNTNSYLSAQDDRLFSVGGFLRSNVISTTSISSTTIDAAVSAYYTPITIHNVFAWVSNPDNNVIYRFYSPCISDTLVDEITSFINIQQVRGIQSDITTYATSPITSVVGMSLSGFSGIYGIAIDPCYNVWMTDSEKDCIYKLSSVGVTLSTLSLRDMPSVSALEPDVSIADVGLTPAGISLDNIGNLWVSLFDSLSVLKINGLNGQVLTAINIGSFAPAGDHYGIYTDPVSKPTLAETDANNNVWVSYTNALSSMLMQFDNNGNYLKTINLPACSNPMDILIDNNNDLWVSLTYHSGPPYRKGSVSKYDTSSLTLVSAITAVHPEYIAMDINGTLWFTSDFNTVTYVTPTNQTSSFTVGSTAQPDWIDPTKLEFNALEGIATDSFGKVFVVNSLENNVYIYNLSGDNISVTNILPDNNYSWYNDLGYITVSADPWGKSAQAFGDWTGFRYQLKYSGLVTSETAVKYISGQSKEFRIEDFSGLNIRRFNESWNPSETIQSYAISPHIHDNTVLWEGLIGAMWGGNEIGKESFGRTTYEKIANYVANHDDIDTSNINQLYSLSNEVDVPIDNYNLNFPPELRRIMDIVSVNQQTLWGSRCPCNLNITNLYETVLSGDTYVEVKRMCPRCGHEHSGNRGQLFDATSYMVTSWTPFVIKDNWQGGTYRLVIPPLSCDGTNTTCLTTYPLSAYYEIVLPDIYITDGSSFDSVSKRFCFSSYVPVFCMTQIAGVINWDDAFTTIDENVSGIQDWYGSGGLVEKLINYTLHKGLGLVEG